MFHGLNSPLRYCILTCLIAYIFSYFITCEASDNVEPPKIGNFALPYSQQPGPLIAFGENIIPKNETQLYLFADDYAGVNKYFIDVIPSVVYGLTDTFSVFINVPYAARYNTDKQSSSALEDAFIQFEYAFYYGSTSTYYEEATVVTAISFPTGSIRKNPTTGFGSPSFFLGMTFNRTYADWLFFGSPGATVATSLNGTKFGNEYLYQIGFGRNIADVNGWIFAWLIEGDGIYTGRNRINGEIDPDSGGNVFYITPSFWASTKKLIFQLGAGYPVTQHFNGNQTRSSYLLALDIGWSF